MPARQAPSIGLGSPPEPQSLAASSPSASDISGASSPEPPPHVTPLFRALSMPPPPPPQPLGQEELERRLPGFRRVVLPREPTLVELLKASSGARTDEEVLCVRAARLRVVAERAGLRRLHVLAPRLRVLTLDGSALGSLRDLGTGLTHLKELHVCRCGLSSLDGVLGLARLRTLDAAGNRVRDLEPLAVLRRLHTLDLSDNPISASCRLWTLGVCASLRRLRLRGSPAAAAPDYSRRVAAALPALQYLDDVPLHEAVLDEVDDMLGSASSSSESEEEPDSAGSPLPFPHTPAADPPPDLQQAHPSTVDAAASGEGRRWRPASAAAAAGVRPPATQAPPRPHSALPSPHPAAAAAAAAAARRELSGLEVLNSLIDAEFRNSSSRLTSGPPVCGGGGSIARALRASACASSAPAPASAAPSAPAVAASTSRELIADLSGVPSLAAEIPPAAQAHADAWVRFRQATGIELDLNFDERIRVEDSSDVLSRLEEIERGTSQRLRREALKKIHEKSNDNYHKNDSEMAPAVPGDSGGYLTHDWQTTEMRQGDIFCNNIVDERP